MAGKHRSYMAVSLTLSLYLGIAPGAFAQSTPTDVVAQGPIPVVAPVPPAAVAQPAASSKPVSNTSVDQPAPSLTSAQSATTADPAATEATSQLIVIDNDDENAAALVQETFKWSDVPDAPGATKITTGAQFPVRVVSELSSKTAKVGDPVEGMVRVDLKIGGRMIAPKGTRVVGHVFNVMPARRVLIAECSTKRWWRANGEIGIQFDEIVTKDGEHIPLDATPARMARIVENKNEGRIMGVNHKGEVASPLSIQLKEQAIHLAIRSAASVGGVFSMGAVPVAYAAIGAMNPSFAYLHPVGKNVPHRRLKGAAMGFISGVPGGFLIADSIIKGVEASIKPGDEFLVQFKQDFTGEPSTDAEMLAGGQKSVHGEVVGRNKKQK